MTTTEANEKLREIDFKLWEIEDVLSRQVGGDYYPSINEHRVIVNKILAIRKIIEI